MYEIMIVDDERIIRKGLRETIDWATMGFHITAEAHSGLQALELLQNHSPDVMIVDIRMPGMDGLELIEKVKMQHPQICFVVLSGHSDFTYAQTAINLGVKRYILKPSSDEEVYHAFNELKLELDDRRKTEHELQEMRQEMGEGLELLKAKVFSDLIHAKVLSSDLRVKASQFLSRYEEDEVTLIIIDIDNYDSIYELWNSKQDDDLQETMVNILREYLDAEEADCCLVQDEIMVLWSNRRARDCELLEPIQNIKAHLKKEYGYFGLTVTIGMSRTFTGVNSMAKAYEQARTAVEQKLIAGTDSIIRFEDVIKKDNVMDQGAKPSLGPLLTLKNRILEYLKAGNVAQVERSLDEMVSEFYCIKDMGKGAVQQACMDIISSVSQCHEEFYERIWPACGERMLPIEKLQQMETMEELLKWMRKVILFTVRYLSENQTMEAYNQIQKAKDYIDSHYYENLTVRQMAGDAYVNTSYFSILFKKAAGMTFTDYLMHTRLTKAKELLISNQLKVYEVAERVGYQEYRSFVKAFKKMYQSTPTEFVENYRGIEDNNQQ